MEKNQIEISKNEMFKKETDLNLFLQVQMSQKEQTGQKPKTSVRIKQSVLTPVAILAQTVRPTSVHH